MKEIKDIEIAGAKVSCKDGMYSLTDLWRAFTNSDMSKRPNTWLHLDETQEYIQVLEKELKRGSGQNGQSDLRKNDITPCEQTTTKSIPETLFSSNRPLYAAGRGHTANSYAHWMLFLAYASI